MSNSVILLVDSLYAEAIEAVKSRTALSASTPWVNLYFRWYQFRGKALKPFPIREVLNRFLEIPNSNIMQYVKYYL
jgi:hypothetical protein